MMQARVWVAAAVAGALLVGGVQAARGQTTTVNATVAGNTSDANGDGLGDNHNALPGSAPLFAAGLVDASGGAGSNGIGRFHIEFPLSSVRTLTGTLSAEVLIHTNRGTVDSLDTFFFSGVTDGDGLLGDADFQTIGAQVAGVVMPVPPLATLPVGGDGTFRFDATTALLAAIQAGFDFLVIQGRVDESLAGGGFKRGLQMRTTASGNIGTSRVPTLIVTQSPPAPGGGTGQPALAVIDRSGGGGGGCALSASGRGGAPLALLLLGLTGIALRRRLVRRAALRL